MMWKVACVASLLLLASKALAANPVAAPVVGRAAEGVGASLGPHEDDEQRDALNVEDLKHRLAAKGFTIGSPVMIRIFKNETELELWIQKGPIFELFNVYRVCNWSGTLGPKLAEGDRQSPEGLYSIGAEQLHRTGRWRRSLDIGFPNTYDKTHGRTGSYILVHGGCTSTGCYAMTDPAMEEIFALSEAALTKGQARIQVHVFPFRMTQPNLAARGLSPWSGFWLGLEKAYDLFEQTRIPPHVRVCDDHYAVSAEPIEGRNDCIANVSAVSSMSGRAKSVRRIVRARRAHRLRLARRAAQKSQARRAPSRNARQAYAAARAARAAAQHRSHLGGPRNLRK